MSERNDVGGNEAGLRSELKRRRSRIRGCVDDVMVLLDLIQRDPEDPALRDHVDLLVESAERVAEQARDLQGWLREEGVLGDGE